MIRPILAGSRDGRFPGQAPGTTPGRGPRSTFSARTVQGLGPDPGLIQRPSAGAPRRSDEPSTAAGAGGERRRRVRLRGEPDPVRHHRGLPARPAGRVRPGQAGAGRRPGHRKDARDRPRHPGGQPRLPEPAVPHPGRVRRPAVLPPAAAGGRLRLGADRPLGRLPGRGRLLGPGRLHRHAPGRAGQRAGRGRGRPGRAAQGHADRLPGRRGGRHVRGRPGPARRRRGGLPLPGRRGQRAVRLRLRGRPAGHVHAGRRGHLHQGRRRRGRPGRQGRAVDPRGRPPQRGRDRRQRRRQRRRLRRHGRRPVRVLRGDAGRGHRPRPGRLPRPAGRRACCSP